MIYPGLEVSLGKLAVENPEISDIHISARRDLVQAVCELKEKQDSVSIIMVCTGNSRRSMMGAAMGNAAVAYHGLDGIRFFSGGTKPSAFNPRAIRALREMGFVIHETGENAPPGADGEFNPCYNVHWGIGNCFTREFSKRYDDLANPRKDFIAIMVCDEADMECPTVQGAFRRISAPFADPKEFDGTNQESARYAQRRDDLGRFMLSTFEMVRAELKRQRC